MIAVNVFGADSDAEGARLRTTMQQAFARLRLGQPGKLPRPVDGITEHLPPAVLSGVNEALSVSATGSPDTVRRELVQIVERYAPDEVIITGQIHDHSARLRSFEIAAEALAAL
jgi:alkanesulfonate monooxygenase SsuD/methylene tetrahydromethanopterin reductase-like flavin-dependent oxidoreductase (luciferase family)